MRRTRERHRSLGAITPQAIIGILITLLALVACARPLTPTEEANSAIGMIKAACVDACSAPPGHVFPITIAPPEGSSLYTTNEAVCLRHGEQGADGLGKRLSCARCPCRVEEATGGMMNGSAISGPLTCIVTALPEEPVSRIAIMCSDARG